MKSSGSMTSGTHRRRGRAPHVGVLASLTTALLALFAIGCTGALSAAAATSKAKSPLTVDVFAPFSGPSANYGNFANLPGVDTGVSVVNAAGGALGHDFNVITTDDLGDVADAVPIAHQLVATHSNLVAVYGNPGEEALETSKIFNAAHIVEFSVAGFDQLNNVYLPYFFRTYPPDTAESLAWADAMLTAGHKKIAIVGSETVDTSSTFSPLISGLKRGGAKVLSYTLVQPDLPSYATIVQKIMSEKPDAIAWDLGDDQTSATFVTNLKEFGAMSVPQYLPSETPDWVQAVSTALGTTVGGLGQYFTFVAPAPGSPVSYQNFLSAFLKLYPTRTGPFNAYNQAMYDGVVITALAMTEANSVKPSVYVNKIMSVTAPSTGAVKVYSYAQGIAALKKGKPIEYVGATGQETFNHFHWDTGNWYVTKITPTGGQKNVKLLTAAALVKL